MSSGSMLASAATTMTAVAFGAMVAVGMRGCVAEPVDGAAIMRRPLGGAAAITGLRAELSDETLTGLCKRASAAGIGSAEVAAALDADAPKTALISLLLASVSQDVGDMALPAAITSTNTHAAAAGGGAISTAEAAAEIVQTDRPDLRAELVSARVKALQKRAAAELSPTHPAPQGQGD